MGTTTGAAFSLDPTTGANSTIAWQRAHETLSRLARERAVLDAEARQILGGPADEGRASYQVSLSVCPACGGGRQFSGGGLVPIGTEVTRMAHCDAQHIGVTAHQPIPANDPAPEAQVGVAAHPEVAAHTSVTAHTGTTAHDDCAHVGATARDDHARVGAATLNSRIQPRATQTIPPALRRAVLLRAQRRCQVPGCQNARFLDVHHVELRSEGGRHSLDNLVVTVSDAAFAERA